MAANEGNGNGGEGAGNGKGLVVSLAEARKRQRTVQRAGANGRADEPKGRAGGSRGGKGPGAGGEPKGWRKILLYGQFLLLLAIVAYMMQLCSHRG